MDWTEDVSCAFLDNFCSFWTKSGYTTRSIFLYIYLSILTNYFWIFPFNFISIPILLIYWLIPALSKKRETLLGYRLPLDLLFLKQYLTNRISDLINCLLLRVLCDYLDILQNVCHLSTHCQILFSNSLFRNLLNICFSNP